MFAAGAGPQYGAGAHILINEIALWYIRGIKR